MKNKAITSYKWTFLPFVFSSATILATSAMAAPGASQQYKDARQVNSANYQYVGGDTQVGIGITDDGDTSIDFNQVVSKTRGSSTSVGLWAGVDLHGDDKGIKGRGIQVNHNWVARGKGGRVSHVNKVFGAYDRNEAGHEKATVGYGQENESLFWEGHVSKGLSGKKGTTAAGVSNKAYDYGVGGSVGTFYKDSNVRVHAGLDHEWGDDLGAGESTAKNTTLSAGVEKFFQGTPHSVGLDVAASKRSGGFVSGSDDTDVTGKLSYRYDFGGASIYQPDRRYKRVRVEVPGQAVAPRYAKKAQFKRVPTYKTIPTYGKKTVRTPYKQLVKSTMELEGQTFFKKNSARLIPSAQSRLKQIATQIRKNGYKGSIRITGNTCGLGDRAYDQRLSEQRAKAVRNFLIKNGFNANHLIARGLGKDHPKYANNPEQGFKNRRVDIEYVSERKAYKTAYRTEQKTVRTGSRKVASGFKNVPAGFKNVMIDSGRAGSPRVIWKTEAIKTSPAWIQRALHNNIKHNTSVNTYQTTAGGSTGGLTPTVVDDAVTLETCSSALIDVLANDKNVISSTLSIKTNPSNGTVEVVNGEIKYTPNDDYVGSDSFTYTVEDSEGNILSASVSVDVTGQCNILAQNDVETTEPGQPVTISVLSNDSDADNDSLTIISVGRPANGTAVISADGKEIVYTPDAGFTGTDSFSYTVSDGKGNTATATATVTVQGSVTLPQASDDSVTLETCTDTVINVLSNDNQGSGNAVVNVTGNAAHGTTTVLADGSIRYTPADDYVGSDSFTYTITDSNGNSSSATVSVTVTGQCISNEAPVAGNDSTTTAQGEMVEVNVLTNDSDPDGDTLTITAVANPAHGTAEIAGNQIIYRPNASFVGTETFTYTISDGNGHTSTATISILVEEAGCNATCTKAITDEANTTMGQAVTINVLANDEGSLALTLGAVDSPSHGSATVVGNTIRYTPVAGFTGVDSFWYGIRDSSGYEDSALIVVYVEEECPTQCQ